MFIFGTFLKGILCVLTHTDWIIAVRVSWFSCLYASLMVTKMWLVCCEILALIENNERQCLLSINPLFYAKPLSEREGERGLQFAFQVFSYVLIMLFYRETD